MHASATATADAIVRTPKRPRRLRTDALAPDYRSRTVSPMPSDRQPPHMLLRRGRDLLLVTCWPARKRGLTDNELTQIADVERRLVDCDASHRVASAAWVNDDGLTLFVPQSEGWIKRMLADRIVLQVRAA